VSRTSEKETQEIDHLSSLYFYEQIPPPIKMGFSYEQKRAIKSVLQRAIKVPSKKVVDIEVTFWFFKRFYLVVYLGLDKRKKIRLLDGYDLATLVKYGLHTLITLLLWLSTLFVMFAAIYYAKSTIGIDIFPEQHIEDVMIGN